MDDTFSVAPHPFKQLYTIPLVSNCAFGVFFTGQQGLYIVVTLGHNLGKDLDGFVSGVGCQVFHDTFSVAPHPFKQLYTIRVPFKDVTGTAVYVFLQNKCQDTYRELRTLL
jgi:hypothetical protein